MSPLKAFRVSLSVTVVVLSMFVSSVRAVTWTEFGDAGPVQVNANPTVGIGSLTVIQGSFLSSFDIDMYCIRIVDKDAFVANLLCGSFADPDLTLFNPADNGITMDDGCQGGFVTLTGAFVPANGIYFLAIGGSEQDALDAGNLPIWAPPAQTGERAPDGPGAPGPMVSWGGNPLATPAGYTILLSGCEFCFTPVSAHESTWGSIKALYSAETR